MRCRIHSCGGMVSISTSLRLRKCGMDNFLYPHIENYQRRTYCSRVCMKDIFWNIIHKFCKWGRRAGIAMMCFDGSSRTNNQ